jgi:predicted kinase
MSRFVVLTGLPASGKSTLGTAIAAALALPLIDTDRFFARKRYAGHLDGSRSRAEELAKFEQSARCGALGIGRLVDVGTERPVGFGALLRQLESRT